MKYILSFIFCLYCVISSGQAVPVTDSVTVNGSASSDADGTITAYKWELKTGPGPVSIFTPSAIKPVIKFSIPGTYVLKLTVTDNQGAVSTEDVDATMTVIVDPANQRPKANAGPDQRIKLPGS